MRIRPNVHIPFATVGELVVSVNSIAGDALGCVKVRRPGDALDRSPLPEKYDQVRSATGDTHC